MSSSKKPRQQAKPIEQDDAERVAEPTPEPETPPAPKPARARGCRVAGCDRKPLFAGLCGAHYASRRGG